MKLLAAAFLLIGLLLLWVEELTAFTVIPATTTTPLGGTPTAGALLFAKLTTPTPRGHVMVVFAAEGEASSSSSEQELSQDTIEFSSEEEKKEAVGNLVADDEWMGLSMELSELVRMAVIEDLKENAREFLGKDEYKVGDISKEIDTRVKNEGTV